MNIRSITLLMLVSIYSLQLFAQHVDTTVHNQGSMTIGDGTGTLMQFSGSQEGTDNSGQAQGGFGILTGAHQISPIVWMYGNTDKNAFKIIKKGYEKTVQNSPSLFEVGANGVVKIGRGNNLDNNSPGLVFVNDDDFLYDGEYINQYGLGSHRYKDNLSSVLGANVYLSGYFGLDFFTEGKNRLRINRNGNVGIGTSSPKEKLEVMGNIKGPDGESTIKGFKHIVGRSTDGILHLMSGTENGSVYVNYNRSGNILLANKAGNVGIGTLKPDTKLTVNGNIHAKEVKIDLNIPAPDYVFKENYSLRSIKEVEEFIKENSHLPEIPSAQEFEKNGVMQAEMDMSLLKKIEELTLYTIQQEKKIEKLEQVSRENKALEARLEKLEVLLENKKKYA